MPAAWLKVKGDTRSVDENDDEDENENEDDDENRRFCHPDKAKRRGISQQDLEKKYRNEI